MSELSARPIVGSEEVRVEIVDSMFSGITVVPPSEGVGLRTFCDMTLCGFALFSMCCAKSHCQICLDVTVLGQFSRETKGR